MSNIFCVFKTLLVFLLRSRSYLAQAEIGWIIFHSFAGGLNVILVSHQNAGINASLAPCKDPCSYRKDCGNCTKGGCMWCNNLQKCVDSNVYVASFPYGQCMEWITNTSECRIIPHGKLNTLVHYWPEPFPYFLDEQFTFSKFMFCF